jgi:sugar/nucleoside kinase (ribokinase family)
VEGALLVGGTVTFSGLTSRALGLSIGVVTSASADLMPGLSVFEPEELSNVPAPHSTCFENIYTSQGRQQKLISRAAPLSPVHLPERWHSPRFVHLAPIADEVGYEWLDVFPGIPVYLTPQGWMRQWDGMGNVSARPLPQPERVCTAASAVVMSIEDAGGDESLVQAYARMSRLLVITRAAEGCTLYREGSAQHIPAPQVEVIDPTGAGDIFAAAFFVHLYRTGDPVQAARFAVLLASHSVSRSRLDSIPDQHTIQQALASIQ